MREIERKLTDVFNSGYEGKTKNKERILSMRDSVEFTDKGEAVYRLWGHPVFRRKQGERKLYFSFCGHPSQTTKSRLNALFAASGCGYPFSQRQWTMYFNEVPIMDSSSVYCYDLDSKTLSRA